MLSCPVADAVTPLRSLDGQDRDPVQDHTLAADRAPDRDAEITGWALAAGHGDRRAAELFVHATYDDVRRFVAHLTADIRCAEDLTQETYLRALPGLSRFAGRSCARSWLLTIARRVVVDRYRRAAARPRIADTADWLGAADRAIPRHLPGFEESVAFSDALRALEQGRRQAFLLTCVLGLSYAEAADALDCPVGTIRSRVARARRDLAEVWSEPGALVAA
ncbi:sigma-70 family RNA polymerase sigma factor [Streptomyces katsurahamanus]|uniref:RNA polymerase sigma factor n=1 Tax=Streptomyces katsurahamanus TaxID=2577098 RepID=A0ABW9NZN2_9ACTN|nr:sigma-70 family RNA polymerase sigma factor [Streptomyces katsurahamanus]MQS38289.1 sigma-70 family RNA polymerase sigma factor [Streptomyces katsurahamanus]